jgi:hypothetical protein
MTQSSVTIQITPTSQPSIPPWLGEVAVFAQVLTHLGLLKAIQERVRFVRARFGRYDLIDFVVVLIGYALSGEPTLKAFYARLLPFADTFMACFGRNQLPDRTTLSRFLSALDQAPVEALRTLFLRDLVARASFTPPGSLSDRLGNHWWVIDVDATKQATRQRALPRERSLPAPHRRLDQVCAPGYLGRKRGEVARTRTTVLQAFTHQWMGTYGGAGNGNYRGELKRALQAIIWYALALGLPVSQMLVRLDGLYGNAAPLTDVVNAGLGVIARSKDYALLKLEAVRARLALPADQECTHPESGTSRALYDCPDIPLAPMGLRMRLLVAVHPAASTSPAVGVEHDGLVYELFVTTLPQRAFSPKDVLDLYLHRGSFEPVLADEDVEQDPDRWCSFSPCGQEFWQILSQWVWNMRLELGQHLLPTAGRTTEFAPASNLATSDAPDAPTSTSELLSTDTLTGSDASPPASAPTLTREYGPPQWARRSFTGGFPGSAFTPQPDGSLLCPANHHLFPQEHRLERNGSYRVLYAARIGDCRACQLRAQCQESISTLKPRRVSAVIFPLTASPPVKSVPALGPPSPPPKLIEPPPTQPVLWHDWPRCQIRRRWLQVIRSETVIVSMGVPPPQTSTTATEAQVFTRSERAHWRLSWKERLLRNARPADAPQLILTLHGLPAPFASAYGFPFLDVA